jgi:hypothetical protein
MADHEIVGQRMTERHRLGFDRAAHAQAAEAAILLMSADAFDQFAPGEDRLRFGGSAIRTRQSCTARGSRARL